MPAFRKRPAHTVVDRSGGSGPGRSFAVGATAVGVVTMVAGTFAPWLASGSSARNLYSSAGIVQRLAGLGSLAAFALDALPLAGLYCVLAAVAYVIGRRRIAGAAIALLAVVLAGVAVAALAHRGPGSIHLLATGPIVTLCGAVLSLAALGLAAGFGRARSASSAATDNATPNTAAPDTATSPGTAAPDTAAPDGNRARSMEFR